MNSRITITIFYVLQGQTALSAPWRESMDKAVMRCTAYGRLLDSGGSKAQIDAALTAAREAIKSFLVPNVALFMVDREFTEAVHPVREVTRVMQECSFLDYSRIALKSAYGAFGWASALLPNCIGEADAATEFTPNCFSATVAAALNNCLIAGDLAEFMRIYKESIEKTDSSGRRILKWTSPMSHPHIFLDGIRNKPIWTRQDDPMVERIMRVLEQNVETFKQELQAAKTAGSFGPAYSLVVGGEWDKLSLYTGGVWHASACSVTPRTCSLLKDHLPGAQAGLPYLVDNNEEVVFFYGSPDSHVVPHDGQTNTRINIHIGLEGYEGSELRVLGNVSEDLDVERHVLRWSDQSAFAFSDGFSHEVLNGPGHRYVLAVGALHPDLGEPPAGRAAGVALRLENGGSRRVWLWRRRPAGGEWLLGSVAPGEAGTFLAVPQEVLLARAGEAPGSRLLRKVTVTGRPQQTHRLRPKQREL